MKTQWDHLSRELDCWDKAAKTAFFWWRDDDATEFTPQLERLNLLSENIAVPLAIAVIPKGLKPSLVEFVSDKNNIKILQHGYSHESFAAEGQKKIEMGGLRKLEDIQNELEQGKNQLSKAFNNHFIPVLVPPWNRINPSIYPYLKQSGFKGLSSMWARPKAYAEKGLYQVNTHLDPVNWRHDRGHIGDEPALTLICEHLKAKRLGENNDGEPTGLLTHHLAQNNEVWEFCEQFFKFLKQHPAVKFIDAEVIWR